jgi:hypothetical protein
MQYLYLITTFLPIIIMIIIINTLKIKKETDSNMFRSHDPLPPGQSMDYLGFYCCSTNSK